MKKHFNHYIPQNLRYLRKKKGLSVAKLADDMEANGVIMNEKKLSSYENSHTEPNAQMLVQICRYFSISIEEFITKDFSKQITTTPIKSHNKNLLHA